MPDLHDRGAKGQRQFSSPQRRLLLRRLLCHSGIAVSAVVASLAFLAAPALAGVSHVFKGSFGAAISTPANPYPLSGPTEVAVDQKTHDVYVNDPGNYRVEKFDSEGHFLLMFGKGVDLSTHGNVCPLNSGDVCGPGSPGSASGQFEDPAVLAVDNSCAEQVPPLTEHSCESFDPSYGDVYVGDGADHLIQKFTPAGRIISTWGVLGQKDGSDSGEGPFSSLDGIDVGPTGTLYTLNASNTSVFEYSQEGTILRRTYLGGPSSQPGLRVDSHGNFYSIDSQVFESVDNGAFERGGESLGPITSIFPTTGFALDPSDNALYQDALIENEEEEFKDVIEHYSPDCNPRAGPCSPLDTFGEGHLFGSKGVAVDGTSGVVYVANTETNDVAYFKDVRPKATTEPPSNVEEASVTLSAHVDLGEGNAIDECHFEYGFDTTYGHTIPCLPATPPDYSGPTDVSATIAGLSPGTHDHYRVTVSNLAGSSVSGRDETFTTSAPPTIDGLVAEDLTATTANIIARVNPDGLETKYHLEYGPSTGYGQEAPVGAGVPLAASNNSQQIELHLEGLTPHVVYHYRLVAENTNAQDEGGTATTEDHTFNFFPPACPNENVRQQTQTNYLPDCRAYELVSPSDAGGTQLYPGGPNTGYATSPSRFSYTGLWGAIPNSGGDPMDTVGDLYVATRTPTGWVTRYVGLPSEQAGVDGGPPQGLPGSATGVKGFYPAADAGLADAISGASQIQEGVLTDPAMDAFVDWNDGSQEPGGANSTPTSSNAPYVWSAEGQFLERWPTNLATVPTGSFPDGSEIGPIENRLQTSPGGVGALDCQRVGGEDHNYCPGDVTASEDLSHFVFASRWNAFAPGGILSAPGSVYDNNTLTDTVTVASKLDDGSPIPAEPTDQAGDPLQIPAVSSDGSHILIADPAVSPCGLSSCSEPACSDYFSETSRCPLQPSLLYMRVNGLVTYEVSQGHAVDYVGSTPDGSKVYFTSEEQLVGADHDASVDLYMWSEASDSLTLISIGAHGEGNSDACSATFTTKCGVVPYSGQSYCQLASGLGGNCRSDNSIASQNGDIYFFSPEQLDGSRGIPNQENLYDFREGQVQYVAAFTTGEHCVLIEVSAFSSQACSNTPVVRMETTPTDSYMAFVTASPLTQYDNAGHLEMYRYESATSKLICVSCIPSGSPATSDVGASQDGLFLANDGRAFFSTEDSLVHADTNHALDIYEYVDGRPQLITQGTGETRVPHGNIENSPGLIGVSANGTDAYFSTYDTLVSEDHNGLVLKFYDARTDGGFPAPPNNPPCEAADECHGAGSEPLPALPVGSEAGSSGGNSGSSPHKGPGKKHHHAHKNHRTRHGRHKK